MKNPFHKPPTYPAKRSPHWSSVRRAFLAKNPRCAACGGQRHLNAHHKRPFHLHPTLELEPDNLITLCEDPRRLCHLRIGHSFDWHAFNPLVVEDALRSMLRIRSRRYR